MPTTTPQNYSVDVAVYDATSGGVMAAVAAARHGAAVLMIWVLPTAGAFLLRGLFLCLQWAVNMWNRANTLAQERHASGASAEDVVPLTSTAGTAAC